MLDTSGNPIAGVAVVVVGTTQGTYTDPAGRFDLGRLSGPFTIRFTSVGYETVQQVQVLDPVSNLLWEIRMKEDVVGLEALVIEARTESAVLRRSAFSVAGLDLSLARAASTTLDDLLRASPGVVVRKEGGLGSRSEFALNGLSGRQVRVFLDGLPLDPVGGSQVLADLPPLLVDRADVYKGVVPVTLGGDALGGAVHLISRPTDVPFTDVSLSGGSFHTAKGAITHQSVVGGNFLRVSGYWNRSANDYRIRVRIPDPQTGTYGPEQSVERFHDGYESRSIQAEVGVRNLGWADEIRLLGQLHDQTDEVQHAVSLDRVFGRVRNWGRGASVGGFWRKRVGVLDFQVRARHYLRESGVVDTSAVTYDWTGGWVPKNNPSIAESSWNKTLFRYTDAATVANAVLVAQAVPRRRWEAAYTLSRLQRRGNDPLSRYPVAFESPNTLLKHTWAISHSRGSATIFAKLHHASGFTTSVDFDGMRSSQRSSYTLPGGGIALSHRIGAWLWKASYERTLRIPDAYEQFGDGLLLLPNPELKPERSHNANFGFLAETESGNHRFLLETQVFLRAVTDLIRVEAVGLTARHLNQRQVRSAGVDGVIRYSWNRRLTLENSFTWQDLRNTTRTEDGRPSYVYGDRIPNIPFWIMSQQATYTGSWFDLGWSGYFVESYFLKWPSLGSADGKHRIPRQYTQAVRLGLGPSGSHHRLTLECLNLTSARAYDHFRLQKPGRSFHITYRFHLR